MYMQDSLIVIKAVHLKMKLQPKLQNKITKEHKEHMEKLQSIVIVQAHKMYEHELNYV